MSRKLLFLSAFLVSIAQPGLYLGFAVFISFVPLFLYFFRNDFSNKRMFLDGTVFGLIISVIALYWVGFSSIAGFIGMSFTIGLRFALLFLLFNFFKRNNYPYWVFIPLFVLHEYAYTLTELDFPWYMIAYSLTDLPFLIQIAELTGIFGISAFIILINYLIFNFIKKRDKNRMDIFKNKVFLISICSYLLINLFVYLHINMQDEEYIKAGVVQPNIDPFYKWRSSYRNETLKRLNKYTHELINEDNDLIVWPETALPYTFAKEPILKEYYQNLVKENNISLIIGSINSQKSKKTNKLEDYNSAYLLSNLDSNYKVYNKMYLLPVIEKPIYGNILSFINNIPGLGGFAIGNEEVVMSSEFKIYDKVSDDITWNNTKKKLNVTVTICIESNYPDLYRSYMNKDVDIITVITNDGWFFPNWEWFRKLAAENNFSEFIPSKGAFQHNRISRVRAIETRRPILRAANTGISSIISFTGESLDELDQYVEGRISAYVPILKNKYLTIYAQFGNYIVLIAFIGLLVLIVDLIRYKFASKSIILS